MDFIFIIGLPLSFGFTTTKVFIIDRLEKYAHFVLLKSGFTSKSVAESFIKNVVRLQDMPKIIVLDRDIWFLLGKIWENLFQLQGTTLAMKLTYHPQTNEQSETLNKFLEMYFRGSHSIIQRSGTITYKALT